MLRRKVSTISYGKECAKDTIFSNKSRTTRLSERMRRVSAIDVQTNRVL